MKILCLLVIISSCTLMSASNQELEAQVKEMAKRIESLEKKVAALIKHKETTPVLPAKPKLEDIFLPTGANKAQVKTYIQTILKVNEGRNGWAAHHPEVRKIIHVGKENVSIILDVKLLHKDRSYYLDYALEELVDESHRALITDRLKDDQSLCELIAIHRWQEDVRDILLNRLKKREEYLPVEWIDCVVSLQNHDCNNDLIWYFKHGANKSYTYASIKDIPGIKLDKAVAETWEEAKQGREYDKFTLAKIAAQYGHLDAIDHLIKYLDENNDNKWQRQDITKILTKHLPDVAGTFEELLKWYKWHKDEMVFNKETRIFEWQE